MEQDQKWTLPREGAPPLVFRGEILAEVGGVWPVGSAGRSGDAPRRTAPDLKRWHHLCAFRTETGKYVGSIGYRPAAEFSEEWEMDWAFAADSPAALADLFARHDPTAGVRGFPVGDKWEAKQARLMEHVASEYRARVRRLFEQLGPEFAERVD